MNQSSGRVAQLLADAFNEAANSGLRIIAISDARLRSLQVEDAQGRMLAYIELDQVTESWIAVHCT